MNYILIRIPRRIWKLKWWKEINRKTPASWDELTGGQFAQVLRLIDVCKDVYTFRIKVVIYFLGLKWWHVMFIDPVQFIQLFEYFTWIEEEHAITRTHFQKLGDLYGPPDGIVGLTALEFALLDRYYLDYRDGNRESIDLIVACLYRERRKDYSPKKHGHDRREEFNPYGVTFIAKKLRKVDHYKKLAVVRYYESYRIRLEENHKEIFTKAETVSRKAGWPDIFMKMAETNVFGNLDAVETAPISMILRKMMNDTLDFEEFKAKHKVK